MRSNLSHVLEKPVAPSAGRQIELGCVRSFDDFLARKSEWDQCVSETGADIYFIHDWIVAWRLRFAPALPFVAFFLRSDDRLVGVFAFCIDTFSLGVSSARIARLIGTNTYFPITSLPVEKEWTQDALQKVFAQLLSSEKCDGISLSPLSDSTNLISEIRNAALADQTILARDSSDREHILVQPSGTFDDYIASLSKTKRREYRRSLAQLSKKFSIGVQESTPDTVLSDFQDFVDLHEKQWQAQGRGGHFQDWPGSKEFCCDVTRALSESGRATVEKLCVDGKPVFIRLSFLQSGKSYFWQTARTLDPEFTKFGVGRFDRVEKIRRLIKSGVESIECGVGNYDYKLGYGGKLFPVRSVVLSSRLAASVVRVEILLLWSDLLNLLYYRIWFLKLAPRLRVLTGGLSKPLSSAWMRSRL